MLIFCPWMYGRFSYKVTASKRSRTARNKQLLQLVLLQIEKLLVLLVPFYHQLLQFFLSGSAATNSRWLFLRHRQLFYHRQYHVIARRIIIKSTSSSSSSGSVRRIHSSIISINSTTTDVFFCIEVCELEIPLLTTPAVGIASIAIIKLFYSEKEIPLKIYRYLWARLLIRLFSRTLCNFDTN